MILSRLTIRKRLILFTLAILMVSNVMTSLVYLIWEPWNPDGSPLVARLIIQLWLLAVSGGVGTLVASRFSRNYLRPILQLTEASFKVTTGDYSVRLPEDHEGEIGKLQHSFNQMVGQLDSLIMFRNDFIDAFTHELKTPIVSIQGFARQLQRDDITENQRREYAAIIAEESQRLVSLSSSVLKLSRLENGDASPQRVSFRLDEQLRSCILLLEKEWTAKKLSLDIDLQDVIWEGDSSLLSEVWINLLGNAVKFTPAGGTIAVRLTLHSGNAVVSISDTGIGMSPENLSHIFDKFFQGSNAQQHKGNGLGLTLAKRIVDISGGEITAVSQENRGTTFTVTLRPV